MTSTLTARIIGVETTDLRFPTSLTLDGSDAMNPDPDYSAAYVVLRTEDGVEGYGFAFTIGRGNDVVVAAIEALRPHVLRAPLRDTADIAELSRMLTRDSQLRWLGPEKGVIHMAIGAMLNAAWDAVARRLAVPVWKLLADLCTEELLDQIDFRYLTDVLPPARAREILEVARSGRPEREARLLAEGYPAYTTSAGWLGYPDAKLRRLCVAAADEGFAAVKLKVGADLEHDVRRLRIAREVLGADALIAIDANQRWDVDQAVEWLARLAPYAPYWIEEPTSPDDILGHATIRRRVHPLRVATGEHVANRVVFKQLLQANAVDVVQIDACRVGGVNENIAILLLAAAFGVPVCPHAGGVGLCELVQHLSMFDFLAVSGSLEGRMIEYVDHLHEHFLDPVRIEHGRYRVPTAPGFSSRIRPETLRSYRFPYLDR